MQSLTRLKSSAGAVVRSRGIKGTCAICGASHWRFDDGPRQRKQAFCPTCGSAERHRAMWLYLMRAVPVANLRILHVAPERGMERQLRAKARRYVSTDLGDLETDVQADLTDLPFEDGEFDLVIISHVLEHIPDDVGAVGELHRVLAPGGRAVMQHPIDTKRAETFEDWSVTEPAERERLFFQDDHVRIYGRDFVERVRAGGFEDITDTRLQDGMNTRTEMRYRLRPFPSNMPERDLEGDRIYVATKAAA